MCVHPTSINCEQFLIFRNENSIMTLMISMLLFDILNHRLHITISCYMLVLQNLTGPGEKLTGGKLSSVSLRVSIFCI